MNKLLEKLNYKGQKRIALLNTENGFLESVRPDFDNIIVDREIDPRCPYNFILIFVKTISEVELTTPVILHNLTADGVLWFCYPKKSSKMVSIDNNWSAMRFRNIKYIKSTSRRFSVLNGN